MESLEPGDPAQVGAYRLLGRLGAGGMGQVYLGVSRGGRKVAVKVLRADLVTDAEFRARFAREVAAARTVNGFYTAPVVDADPGETVNVGILIPERVFQHWSAQGWTLEPGTFVLSAGPSSATLPLTGSVVLR